MLLAKDGIFPITRDSTGRLKPHLPASGFHFPGTIQGEGKLESVKEGTPNENPLFATQQIARPMISEKAPLKGVNLRDSYLYDYATQAGETIVVTGE